MAVWQEPLRRRPRRVFLPERRQCGPWQRQRPKPRSKKLIIAGTGGIIGTRITTAIIGIPTAIIITGVTIGNTSHCDMKTS